MAQAHGEWKKLGTGALTTQDADEGLGHIVPINTYGMILGALLVLTIITVAVSRVDLGAWNTVVALVVATIKAGLVAAFFMHLKFEKRLIILYAVYPLVLLFILVGSTTKDEEHKEDPSNANVPFKTAPAANLHGSDSHHE
jgi:cytochrome c oxidase subunit 4